ncbi:MAG: tRNA-dihydrouridine synthase [Gammaproteobacteria bacterium]|nr:tRNA-dihydrouridine synthase [Gammaproteobacteria bacterium]
MTNPPDNNTVAAGRILLAPMEGVIDFRMREMLTRNGGFERCVTEFVRVTQTVLPERVFLRFCPELDNDGYTKNGTPVFLQLLGSDPLMMARNAARAASLGTPGIDLNFGCPAKTVNRHKGGSILLDEPHKVAAIVQAVRDAVPPAVPVTAKIRLGVHNAERLEEIASGVERAGADELCIHARTRNDGYKPPAYWSQLRAIREKLTIPLIANGEIWSLEHAAEAQRQSACNDLMLGRGALACPDLAHKIRAGTGGDYQPMNWREVVALLQESFDNTVHARPQHIGDRLKQWLVYLRREYSEANVLFQQIKRLKSVAEINAALALHRR